MARLVRIIKIYSGGIFQDVEDIFNIEVLLGGDHGKGGMIFVAVLILQFRTENKNPNIIELQIGEVDSSKDMMELLHFIAENVTPGIQNFIQ